MALDAFERARVQLVLNPTAQGAFFATLALRLRMVATDSVRTAATDGETLWYSPKFISELSPDEAIGVMCHEVLHCALRHQLRRDGRHPRVWNVAADLAINCIVVDSQFKLPGDCCFPSKGPFKNYPKGLSSEEYFELLEKDIEESGKGMPSPEEGEGSQGQGNGQGQGQGEGLPAAVAAQIAEIGRSTGAVVDSPHQSAAEKAAAEQSWQIALKAAAKAAQSRGNMPSGLAAFVEAATSQKVDWRNVLRRFIVETARHDYTWQRPNRRFVSAGLYLPSLRSEQLQPIAVAVDTSGSITEEMAKAFLAEITSICELEPVRLSVFFHTTDVYAKLEWTAAEGPLNLPELQTGGTSHIPVFAEIAALDEPPACVVCLTDLYTEFPADPCLPVMWATTGKQEAPFGDVLPIEV